MTNRSELAHKYFSAPKGCPWCGSSLRLRETRQAHYPHRICANCGAPLEEQYIGVLFGALISASDFRRDYNTFMEMPEWLPLGAFESYD